MKYSEQPSKQFLPTMFQVNTSTGNYKYFTFYRKLLSAFGLLPFKSRPTPGVSFYVGFLTIQGAFLGFTTFILNRFEKFEIVGYTQTSNYVEYFQLLSSGVTQLFIDLWMFRKRHRFLSTLDDFMLMHRKYLPERWRLARRYFWWYIQLGVLFVSNSAVTVYFDAFSSRAFIGESQYLLQYFVSGIIISFYTFLIQSLKHVLEEINELIDFQVKAGTNMKKPIQRLLLDRSKVIYDICGDLNDIFGIPFILISFFKILEICNIMLFMISKLTDSQSIGIWEYLYVMKGSVPRLIPPSILFAMSFEGHLIKVQVRNVVCHTWTD